MRSTPEFRADRIRWKFEKSGAYGARTLAWSDAGAARCLAVAAKAALRSGELPVLLHYADEGNWCLLTSDRVVWVVGEAVHSVAYSQLVDATVTAEALSRGKRELSSLTIILNDGRHQSLQLEQGEPFSGFWNVLKMVAQWHDE